MKLNFKNQGANIVTFIVFAIFAGSAMADGGLESKINNATATGARIFQAVAAGIGIVALMYEGIQLIAFKKPVLKQIAMIVVGLVLIIGAAEVVDQFYGSGATGF